jgi:hypothetical protein
MSDSAATKPSSGHTDSGTGAHKQTGPGSPGTAGSHPAGERGAPAPVKQSAPQLGPHGPGPLAPPAMHERPTPGRPQPWPNLSQAQKIDQTGRGSGL